MQCHIIVRTVRQVNLHINKMVYITYINLMWFSSNSRQIILLIVKTTYIYVISSSQKSVVVTFTVVSMPLVHSSLLLYILYILYVSKSVWQKKINRCENKNIFLHRKTDYKLYIFIVYSCKIDMKQQLIVVVELPTQKFFKNCQNFCVLYGFIVSWLVIEASQPWH